MKSNITFNDYHLPTIARLCKELGSPSEGPLASFVWRLANSPALPSSTAEEFMHSAGYDSFPQRIVTNRSPLCYTTPIPNTANTQSAVETMYAWTDGGSRGNPGPSAYGVVFRNHTGSRVAELSKFVGHTTNNMVEYEALLAALIYAEAKGYKSLQVYSDSELMVNQIRGTYRVRDKELRNLYARATELIRGFESFSIDHIDRASNSEADRLVNQAINRGW